MRALLVVLSVMILTGCSAPASPPPSEAPAESPAQARTEADWDQYPPDAQRLIDEAQAAGDCTALQDTFDVADNAGFLAQMKYIDEALELAGCYD